MNNKVFKRVCNIFLDILIGLFSLVLVVTIYNDVQVKVLNKSYADFFGYSTFEVQTGSMTPTIKANDWIIVKINNSPKINDIITYKKDDNFITHRVIESYRETFVTKGDANNAKDEAIKKDQIVGIVVKVIPNFGAIRKTILNPIVLVTLIITGIIISRIFSNKPSVIKKILSKKKKSNEEIRKMEEELDKPVLAPVLETTNNDQEMEELKETLNSEQSNTNENNKNEEDQEEDYEKTILFRKVSVDSIDLNPEPPKIIEVIEEEPIVIEEEEIKEEEAEEKLKKLKKKHSRFKNIVEKIMSIKEQEIIEIIKVLDDTRLKSNEATIKEKVLKIYMDAKYYSQCGDITIDYNIRNMCSKLEEVIKTETDKMVKGYKGNDKKYEEKVIKFKSLYLALINIEYIDSTNTDINNKVAALKKKIIKYLNYNDKELNSIIKEIIKIQRVYNKIINDTLNNTETTTFELHYNSLITNKNIYGLSLEHNISFSKVYSNYIISKTYDEGVVAEDKVLVILNLLLKRIAQDMISTTFKSKYLLYLPKSIYNKRTKVNNILKILDDEYVKNCVYILVKSSVITNQKKLFKEIKKAGYKIAIIYDNEQTKEKNSSIYSIASYLFVDKKTSKEIYINSIDSKSIIIEDIYTKVDIPRGEE